MTSLFSLTHRILKIHQSQNNITTSYGIFGTFIHRNNIIRKSNYDKWLFIMESENFKIAEMHF